MSDPHAAPPVTGRQQIVIERTYRASLEELWALWTTREGFESWWGPDGFRVEVHTIDARPGGALVYDMIADAPEQVEAMRRMGRPISHPAHAIFSDVRLHERVAVTHLVDFLPGVEPYESTMAAEFSSSGDVVRMVVTLQPMHDETFTKMSVMGFTSQLGKLDRRFASA